MLLLNTRKINMKGVKNMNFLQDLSHNLSELTGISETPILLIIYSIIVIIIMDLLYRGITFLNTQFNKNEKALYLFNKKAHIVKTILTILILLFIWENQIQNIITIISFMGAAATLAIRDIILNFFAGIYISVSKSIRVEDRIEVNSTIGDVVNLNTLNFEILEVNSKDEGEQSTGIIVQIPNSKIFTEAIKNYTKAFKYIWNELEVKIKLNANLEHNKKVLYDIVNSNDIVKRIPKKMQHELNDAIGDYRIYYNNLEPIIYTKLTEEYVDLTIRYLAHPKKARHIESQIWNKIYENAKENNLDLYTKTEINPTPEKKNKTKEPKKETSKTKKDSQTK